MMHTGTILRSLILLVLGACSAPQPNPVDPKNDEPRVAVYLVAHEKHSGIAVRRADIPAGLWPEIRDFPQADYLEVGWGDRDYYYGRNQGFTDALRAAFGTNNPSVLHVAGVRGPLTQSFPASEIIEVDAKTWKIASCACSVRGPRTAAAAAADASPRPRIRCAPVSSATATACCIRRRCAGCSTRRRSSPRSRAITTVRG